MRQRHLNFVTLLTVGRFPLVLVFFAAAMLNSREPRAWIFIVAFSAVVLAAVTDLFDGYFARRLNVETPFGAHVDPLMDKFFYLSTLPLLVYVAGRNGHHTHAASLLILTLLFLARDQWVTFLRSIGSMYNVSGRANWSGKVRTCVNFPLICGIYHMEAAPERFQFLPPMLVYTFEGISLFLTLFSLYVYTKGYWPHLVRSASLDLDKQGK